MRTLITGLQVLGLSLPLVIASPVWAQKLDGLIDQEAGINRESQRSQKRIDKISDHTQTLLDEFKLTRRRIDTLRVYNRQLDTLIASQVAEIASLEQQIEDVVLIEREIMPLMEEMVAGLDRFVELDVPFLPEERSKRIANLKKLMDRSDVSVAEKYRKIMEAWQIENDYGRAVDTYRSTIEIDGRTISVDFLKIGRVAFLYKALDDSEAGVWDAAQRTWVPADEHISQIRQGLKMANKQVAVDLLTLPVPAPQVALPSGSQESAGIAGGEGVGE